MEFGACINKKMFCDPEICFSYCLSTQWPLLLPWTLFIIEAVIGRYGMAGDHCLSLMPSAERQCAA